MVAVDADKKAPHSISTIDNIKGQSGKARRSMTAPAGPSQMAFTEAKSMRMLCCGLKLMLMRKDTRPTKQMAPRNAQI